MRLPFCISGICLLFLLCCVFSLQAQAAPARTKTGVPTSIQSVNMEYSASGQTVVFLDNVHVVRPDFELWSKKLTVYLKKKDAQQTPQAGTGDMEAGDVDHLVAEGSVRFKSKDRSGECAKATYFVDADKVVMEGSPVLRDPDTTIRGSIITHFIEENRTQVGGAVNATFQTPERSGASPGRPANATSGSRQSNATAGGRRP
ncbi:MAG: LptA/OstA family protein [Deltaproteobacteria bacterium]|nr:LptA/OstA family protein [Deltaproteobacteria bacterium]